MKRIVFIVFVFIFSYFQFTEAGNEKTVITGLASDYPGKNLVFFTFLEQQFDFRDTIAIINVDQQGKFNFSIKYPETITVYCETKSFTAYIYAESGKNYHITLPSLKSITAPQDLNPFTTPPLLHILPADSVINGLKDLNYAIRNLDIGLENLIHEQLFQHYYLNQKNFTPETLLSKITEDLQVTDPVFFADYIFYKTARFELIGGKKEFSEISEKYLFGRSPALNNTAFWEFFNLYFDHYFNLLSSKKEHTKIYENIYKKQYELLAGNLKNDLALANDTIRELVIMNELFQGFHKKDYSLMLTVDLIDSLREKTSSPLISKIALNLKRAATSLQPDYYPPAFHAKDQENKQYELDYFKGKYLYLGFCSLNHFGSLKEMEYLKYLHGKYSDQLQVLIIVPETEKDEIKTFKEKNSIQWPVLYVEENSKIFNEYKIKAFPVFYLIDGNGKLALSPSPLPSENFDYYFYNIIKTKGNP